MASVALASALGPAPTAALQPLLRVPWLAQALGWAQDSTPGCIWEQKSTLGYTHEREPSLGQTREQEPSLS